jgi:hypothetical protein
MKTIIPFKGIAVCLMMVSYLLAVPITSWAHASALSRAVSTQENFVHDAFLIMLVDDDLERLTRFQRPPWKRMNIKSNIVCTVAHRVIWE